MPTTGPMIESTRAASAATTGGTPSAATPPTAKTKTNFANELAKSARTAASTATPAPRPDGEQTKKIAGHPFSRIQNGSDKGLYLNQLAGSPRQGSVFRLARHDDRLFHVYGSGKDRVIVEVRAQAKTTSDHATPATSKAPATSKTPAIPAVS
jgi:hypothetical protein